jgi:hypothetical protein
VAKPALALAAVCAVAGVACKSNKSKLDELPANAGSAAAAAASGSGASLAECPDDMLKPRIESALAASKRYFMALQTHAATWSTDCEAIRIDLLALEPDGDLFMQAMMSMKAWGRTLSAACRSRVEVLGELSPLAEELEAHSPALEAHVKPVLKTCNDHPGFRDAARKGLRLMKKKST